MQPVSLLVITDDTCTKDARVSASVVPSPLADRPPLPALRGLVDNRWKQSVQRTAAPLHDNIVYWPAVNKRQSV